MFVYSLIYVIMEPKEFAKIVGGSEVFLLSLLMLFSL